MEEIDGDINVFSSPANIVISGCTGSGKTMLTYKLLCSWPFQKKMGNFIFMFNVWQPIFETFLRDFPSVKFIQGLSEKDIENREIWRCDSDQVNICVIDDLVDNALRSETFAKLFTVYGHHFNIINIFITQNLYFKGPFSTTVNRNVHYYFLTRTPHLNVINSLNSQLYGSHGPLKAAFLSAMELNRFSYLLIDVFCADIKNRLKNNVFSDEGFLIIWRPLSI